MFFFIVAIFSSVVGLNVLSALYCNATNLNNVEFSIKPTAQVNSPFELTQHDNNIHTLIAAPKGM